MFEEDVKVDRNDFERGVALRMPMPELRIVGYRVPVHAKLADGTSVEVHQYRGSSATVHDEALVLHREAEQLLGLCDWLQEQLLAATGGMRMSHFFLKSVAAGLEGQGVQMDAENFTASNKAAAILQAKIQSMCNDANGRTAGFMMAVEAGLERYSEVTGEPVNPLVKMAMKEVIHAAMMDFLVRHWGS